MNPRRIARVKSVFFKETSSFLLTEIQAPEGKCIIITGVELASDMGWAKIFYMVMSGSSFGREAIEDFLVTITPKVRTYLSHRVDLRHIPQVKFVYDDTNDKAQRIEELLKKIEKSDVQ